MATSITLVDDVCVLRLDEGRGNSLSFETIAVLEDHLDDVEKTAARALVITGAGKVFCAGLDLRACVRFDRPTMSRYVDAFEGLFEKLFSFPLPTVAAVNGHAIAGGAVIALACDARVMAPSAELALNEVELALPFPSFAFEIGRFGFPAGAHVDGLMLGKRFGADEAVARGIVDQKSTDVDADALERARAFTTRGARAVGAVKRMLRAEVLERARAHALVTRRAFLDAWFDDDARTRVRALVDKLEKR